jgi:ubiquinol-cytochrome c reductase cytochrome b subunit
MSDWHGWYREKYAKLKKEGVPFFPDVVFKDALVALLIFAVLCVLAARFGAKLESLADPTDTAYNPRPEWYFLFLFQALKAFPGSLEAVAAVVLPGAGVLFLLALPFLDRGAKRHPFDRPLLTGLGLAGIAGFVALTVAGARAPLTNPVFEEDAAVVQGKRLYGQLNCAYCHSIDGKGGLIGPELDKAVGKETEEWLERHFRDPRAVTPGSRMPQLHLLDPEIKDLTAYMESIAIKPYTKDAPRLFTENCSACHTIRGEGGNIGPDLSQIGAGRNRAFIKRYITNSTKLYSKSQMPTFEGALTDVQIEDLARYLSSLGR